MKLFPLRPTQHISPIPQDERGEDKKSGNSDCILLSHLEINEATHKGGGASRAEKKEVTEDFYCDYV